MDITLYVTLNTIEQALITSEANIPCGRNILILKLLEDNNFTCKSSL